MATLQNRPVASVTANLVGQSGSLTIKGVTSNTTTQENAAQQINVLLGVVNKSVAADGLTRTIIQDGGE